MRRYLAFTGLLALALSGTAHPASILVINGTGTSSAAAPLTAAGYSVIGAAFGPGAIATALSAPGNDIVQVWIWNDGTFGNTGSPEDPLRAFNAADQAALTAFSAARPYWIMDGLAWRSHGLVDEQNFTKNEAFNLSEAGGGIVLGADDSSGAAIVQHVNQVAGWFGFDLFGGVYSTPPATQLTGGSFFTTPNPVNPANIATSTGTYSEVPHGAQPNGIVLGTAVFGLGTPTPGYGSSPLPGDVFNGTAYPNVNHLITTNIPGATIPQEVPEPSALLLLGASLFGFVMYRLARRQPRDDT
jgi:hypothetical protein